MLDEIEVRPAHPEPRRMTPATLHHPQGWRVLGGDRWFDTRNALRYALDTSSVSLG
ncbi:MAG: hypothetical protein JSW49_01800 [candidate division WOR-3 bacterium]|nr:MAG: hypothetical protein JSW49_01800 [candidate division WOR-3 bacterium]